MRLFRRPLPLLALVSLAVILFVGLRPAEPIDPETALEEYHLLKQHLSRAWANMEWIAGHRGVDLAAVDARTTAALEEVSDVEEAREILARFVRSFGDPHFYSRPVKPSLAARLVSGRRLSPDPITSDMSGRAVCKALGFGGRDLDFALRFSRRKAFKEIASEDNNPFEAGILPLESGRRVGLLRIAHFGDDGYPEVCREAWEEYRKTMEGACTNGWCAEFRSVLRNRLLAYIEDRVRALGGSGYDLLVVDITGNGGGNDWVGGAARIVSPVRLSCNSFSFVKHPHWRKILLDNQQDVRADLARENLTEPVREILASADERLQSMIDQTEAPCDRMPMWEGKETDGGCSNLVEGETTTCGLFPYLDQDSLEGIASAEVLYKAFQNEFNPGINTKSLAVLVDHGTASASEDFGSILQDNGAAVILGSRTYGAGCGFVNGGIPLVLEKVGLKVMAPDCIRYRKNGMNEIEGISPDVDLGWEEDSSKERTRKALTALAALSLD